MALRVCTVKIHELLLILGRENVLSATRFTPRLAECTFQNRITYCVCVFHWLYTHVRYADEEYERSMCVLARIYYCIVQRIITVQSRRSSVWRPRRPFKCE